MNKVIFACVHSAGRSQMATAWFNHLADPTLAKAFAAGTNPADRIHPVVVEAMKEVGMEFSLAKPTLLTEAMAEGASFLITMGCGESCPVTPPHVRRLDWAFPDPKGQPIEAVREIREAIRFKIGQFVNEEGWGKLR